MPFHQITWGDEVRTNGEGWANACEMPEFTYLGGVL